MVVVKSNAPIVDETAPGPGPRVGNVGGVGGGGEVDDGRRALHHLHRLQARQAGSVCNRNKVWDLADFQQIIVEIFAFQILLIVQRYPLIPLRIFYLRVKVNISKWQQKSK